MRILILVDCYFPTPKSTVQLIHDLAVELGLQGHAVTVLAPSESAAADVDISMSEGYRVVRVRTGRLKGAARFLRGLREVFLGRVIWKKAKPFFRDNLFDLIVFYSPTVFWGGLVARLKQQWSCPAYLVLRDIWPQFLVETGVLTKGSPVHRFFRRKEIQQNNVADVIGVQSRGDLDYFAHSFPGHYYRVEVLENWVSARPSRTVSRGYRSQWGLENKIVFFYGGNFGIAQDMDNLLRLAASMLPVKEAVFLFVGGGSESERLVQTAARWGLSNVSIQPPVSPDEYWSVLQECADVGLISLDRRFRIQNIPGKLLGYLLNEIPVLASVNPGNDLSWIIPESGAGFCCENGEDEKLLGFARQLATDPALRESMGRKARALLEERFATSVAARQISRIGKPGSGLAGSAKQ